MTHYSHSKTEGHMLNQVIENKDLGQVNGSHNVFLPLILKAI